MPAAALERSSSTRIANTSSLMSSHLGSGSPSDSKTLLPRPLRAGPEAATIPGEAATTAEAAIAAIASRQQFGEDFNFWGLPQIAS